MATVSVIKLKIRRGTDSDRRRITLDIGEIGYVTNPESRRLFVGDGSTKGGNPAGIKFYSGNLLSPEELSTAQVGDIIFNSGDNKLYALTGVNIVNNFPNYNSPSAYQFIGSRVDTTTISYDTNGRLKITDKGVGPDQVSNSLFDQSQGVAVSPAGVASVKYDNETIKVKSSGELYVDPSQINLSSLNTNTVGSPVDGSNIIFNIGSIPSVDPGIPGQLYHSGGGLRVSL
jgi:hypothetical protein